MDVSTLWVPVVYFLTFAELILVLGLAFNYATTPYAEGTTVAHRYKRRHNAIVLTMGLYGIALILLLGINRIVL